MTLIRRHRQLTHTSRESPISKVYQVDSSSRTQLFSEWENEGGGLSMHLLNVLCNMKAVPIAVWAYCLRDWSTLRKCVWMKRKDEKLALTWPSVIAGVASKKWRQLKRSLHWARLASNLKTYRGHFRTPSKFAGSSQFDICGSMPCV